jgi:heme/copper-type cytochrome/quinol oxidase subunit 2
MRSKIENLVFILNVIWQALILTTSTEHVPVAKPVQTSLSSSVVHNSFYCPPSLLPHHMQGIQRHMLQVTHAQPNRRFKR